jgi:hypothetical protein
MVFRNKDASLVLRNLAIVLAIIACYANTARGQVVNPADKQSGPATQPSTPSDPQRVEVPVHTWSMPPINVYDRAPMVEEDRIGSYAQPRWTAHRRFGETRVYVVPKGMVEFEYWLVPETPKGGGPTELENRYEIEFGLPHRFQLDLYAVGHKTGNFGNMKVDEQKVEVRYAFADWGKIPTNPTLYVEWKGIDGAPDHMEVKTLFGGQLGSRWHWGSNLVFEHEMGGVQENSKEWTTGLSYTVKDTKFAVGAETQVALVNEKDSRGIRGPLDKQFLIGPSIQFRPLPQMHIDVAPLIGTTKNSPASKVFVVLGWEF